MTADKNAERGGRVRNYDFKSGGVIEILKQLKLSFEDQLEELRKAETNAANSHQLSNAAQEDAINAAEKAKKGEAKAGAEADLNDATEARNAAQTVLDDTKKSCTTRADEFESRTKNRAGEDEAMKQAVEILHKITGTRTPEEKGVFFLQLGKSSDPRSQIVNLIRKAANAHILTAGKDGKMLQKLADAIAKTTEQPLGSGTFDQIVNMIQKMIFQLKSEQTDEDNHKGWCDTEIAKTTKMLEDKNTTKEALTADINALSAELEELATSIKDNNQQVSELQASIEQMTEQRQEDKAENSATVKDAQDAQTAVASAVAVLTDFYKSTGAIEKESWEALVQMRTARRSGEEPGETAPEPELWEGGKGSDYKGNEEGVGVIGMLEEIATDFAKMEQQAKSDEVTQQDQYDADLTAAQVNVHELETDTKMKTARSEQSKEKLLAKQKDFKNNEHELEATEQYMKDLEPACINGDSTYEDRKGARTAEIEALKEAQGILQTAFD